MLFKRWHCSSSPVPLYRAMNKVHWNCHSCELHKKHIRNIKDTVLHTDQDSAGMKMKEGSTAKRALSHYNQTLIMDFKMFLDFCFNHGLLKPFLTGLLKFDIAKVRWELKYLGRLLFSKRTTVSLNVSWIQQQRFYLHLLNYCTDHYTDKYIMNPWNVTQSGLENKSSSIILEVSTMRESWPSTSWNVRIINKFQDTNETF